MFEIKTRILVALVGIPLIFVIIYLLPPVAVPVAVAVLSAIGASELIAATPAKGNRRIFFYTILEAAALPFAFFYGLEWAMAAFFLFPFAFLLLSELIFDWGKAQVTGVACAFFSGVMVPVFLASLVRLHIMEHGKFLILLPFVIAFLSDGGGYFGGRWFGKNKLAPKISPKKTVEGAIGGLICGSLGAVIFGLVMQLGFHLTAAYPVLVVLGLVGAVISQMGDLFFSAIKRQAGIKDFGSIFPGHGGVLDRFDSVLVCAPLVEMAAVIFPILEGTV